MTNFHNPAKVEHDFCAYPSPSGSQNMKPSDLIWFLIVTLVKFWHMLFGLYMWVCPVTQVFTCCVDQTPIFTCSWEFVTTLDYEWGVFRGHRQYLWTIWVCSSEASLLEFT